MAYPLPVTGLEWHFPFQGDRLDASGSGEVLTLSSGADNFSGGGFYPTGVAARLGSGGANGGYPFVSTTQWLNKTVDWSLSMFVSHDAVATDDYICKIRSVDGVAFKLTYQKTVGYQDMLIIYPSVIANKRFLLPGNGDGVQYHLVLVWSQAAQAFTVYVDGVSVTVLSGGAGGAGTDTNMLGGNAVLQGYLAHPALNIGYAITAEEAAAMAAYDPTAAAESDAASPMIRDVIGSIINPDGIVTPVISP